MTRSWPGESTPAERPSAAHRPTTVAHYVGSNGALGRPAGPPTDWAAIFQARPRFPGHHQPRLPADLGFYDLMLREVRDQQARLARQHGVDAFCYHYRWTPGTGPDRLLRDLVDHGWPGIRFCLAWGADPAATSDDHAQFLLRAMRHPRYLRVGGRPVLFLHDPNSLADPKNTLSRWRDRWAAAGLDDVHIVRLDSDTDLTDPTAEGADAAAQFLPHSLSGLVPVSYRPGCIPDLQLCSYAELMQVALEQPAPDWTRYESVIPGWDDSSQGNAEDRPLVVHDSTPELYELWLRTVHERAPADGLVLINAWNDWHHAAYLEPDLTHGQGYLHATARATGAEIAAVIAWNEITADLLGLQYA